MPDILGSSMDQPTDLYAWRKAKRAELLAAREALPLELRRTRNEAITRLLNAAFDVLAGTSIGFCWPYRAEPDTRFFLHAMRTRGARTARDRGRKRALGAGATVCRAEAFVGPARRGRKAG